MIARRHLPVIAGGLLTAPSLARAQSETLREGFSPSRLDRFAPAMAREIERGSFLGAVALIARNGEVVHH